MTRPPNSQRASLILGALVLGVSWVCGAAQASTPRVVSLNPSLTAILLAVGAEANLVEVDDYSAAEIPEVAALPRVGGLFSPSLEAVMALRPDAVVLVPSAEQRDFRARLEQLGIRVVAFANIRFEDVLENIRGLGALVGRESEAAARIAAVEKAREEALRLGASRSGPEVLVVLQREPVFVVGSGNFIEEMLIALGARNLAAEFPDAYPRVAVEWLIAHAPDVLIDLSGPGSDALAYWSRWPSIPAVANGRVVSLDAQEISMPGPHLDRAYRHLAVALYGVEAGGAFGSGAAP